MKSSRASGPLGLAIFAILTGSSALADDTGWYFGLNGGQAHNRTENQRVINDLADNGFATSAYHHENRHAAVKAYFGYDVNRYFAFEGGFFDLGNMSFRATTVPAGELYGSYRVKGANFDLLGFWPMGDKFSAFARVGVSYADVKDHLVGSGAVVVADPRRSEKSANLKYGAGFQYKYTESFAMRLEGERYQLDDARNYVGDADVVSLGFVFKFGRVEPPAPAPMQTYTPPPPPAPEPVVVAPPPPVETERYCALLDFEFEINKSTIQLEEKEKFRVVSTFLTKYPETTAVVEGHTDNVGTDEANLRLSQRRADAVVSYLANNFNIDRSRLNAVGYGESAPIADNSTDEGKRANRRITTVVNCATDIEGLRVRPERPTMALQIDFEQNQAAVQPQYRDELQRVANFLSTHTEVTATVEGHTADTQATAAAALEISQRRADNVLNYLVENFGVERSRLTAKGFGNTRRASYNSTFEGQQDNRRVNIIINYPTRQH